MRTSLRRWGWGLRYCCSEGGSWCWVRGWCRVRGGGFLVVGASEGLLGVGASGLALAVARRGLLWRWRVGACFGGVLDGVEWLCLGPLRKEAPWVERVGKGYPPPGSG
ncbi:hypothetical protein Acsp05_70360 [Actinokineospora sp. NBRC 105648]|nr:hypothetical protein Acsp05_70360 [Actinokineospora sp. NBRC 105648]